MGVKADGGEDLNRAGQFAQGQGLGGTLGPGADDDDPIDARGARSLQGGDDLVVGVDRPVEKLVLKVAVRVGPADSLITRDAREERLTFRDGKTPRDTVPTRPPR